MITWKEALSKKGAAFDFAAANADPDFIRNLRHKLNMSQKLFSAVLGVSTSTVEKWETSEIPCDGAAGRLLFLLDRHPGLVCELYTFQTADSNSVISENLSAQP